MTLVVVESPYAGDVKLNEAYARACIADSLGRNETPFASHLFYTQSGILEELNPDDRRRGILAGYEWGSKADKVVFYMDLGWSNGMHAAYQWYTSSGCEKPIVLRKLPSDVLVQVMIDGRAN